MKNTTYAPQPIDTDGIVLPQEIGELVEQLAKNNHDVWAAQRIAQGWRYGEKRDDAKKETPCLVPYEQLPETEKEYDRGTAIGVLRHIIRLGYSIEKKKTEK